MSPATEAPAGPTPRGAAAWGSTVVAFLVAAAYLARLQLSTPFLPESEGYFHARFAALLPAFGFGHEFEWAAHGVWAGRFADLDLLYHALLAPFTRAAGALAGAKVAAVAIGAAAVASFHAVLLRERVRRPGVWTAMLFCAGSPFVGGLAGPGPEALSLLLLVWCVHATLARSRLAPAFLAAALALTGDGFYLPLILAAAAIVEPLAARRKPDWRPPAALALGAGAGLLLHPQFPYNFRLLWLERFGEHASTALEAALGSRGPSASELLRAYAPVAWLAPIAVYLILARPGRTSTRTRVLFLAASAALAPALGGWPVLHASVPLGLLLAASFFTDHLPDVRPIRGASGRLTLVLGAAFLVFLGWLTLREASARFRSAPPLPEREARYLAEHTEPGELVFTCTADEANELFLLAPRNRYLVVADPRWMYREDPTRWRTWYELAHGRLAGRTYDFLDPELRYGLCGSEFGALRALIEKDPRLSIALETPGAYVFEVDRRRGIGLDEFMELRPESDPPEVRR